MVSNIFTAFAAQGIGFVVSIIMSLLVPKVLSVEQYGYWQLFIFYSSYSGFFLFGLCDGIYLLNGGKSRDEIDRRDINSQYAVGLVMQAVIAVVIVVLAAFTTSDENRFFVLVSFSLITVITNISGILGLTFQAINETKLYSYSRMVDRLVFAVPLVVMVVLHVADFRCYVVTYLISMSACCAYCVWHARDIIKAGLNTPRAGISSALCSMQVGYKLMFATIADMLILGICRFLVDSAWGIEAFANVSFSLSIVNFFITFVTQASMVLFPALRQGSEAERRSFYRVIRDSMELCFPVVYLLYFPMASILGWWLPQYSNSLIYFAFLLPICVFNTKMDVGCSTYFKVLRMEKTLLVVNLVTVAASSLLALVSVFVLQSLQFVLLGAVASIIGRSLYSERLLNRCLNCQGMKMAYEEVLLTAAFMFSALFIMSWLGFFLYLICYFAYILLNQDCFKELIATFSRVFVKTNAIE